MNTEMDIRVAKIIEIDKIVINKGFNDKINEHMVFLVYEEGEEIIDPSNNKSLGYLENPKGKFKPFHVQPTMTIIVSELKRPNTLFDPPHILGIDPEYDLLRTIKIGDKVKIINKT